jgi:hypothetical protein
MPVEEPSPTEWAAKIEHLVQRAEALADSQARRVAIELLQVVMDYHAAALDRFLGIVNESPGGEDIIRSLAEDSLTSSALILHDLHPDSFEERIERALHRLRLQLNPRGANLILLENANGKVRLRYTGPLNKGIPEVRKIIENAISEIAPETAELIIEGIEEESQRIGFVPLDSLLAGQTK